jgi:hypothetical protein
LCSLRLFQHANCLMAPSRLLRWASWLPSIFFFYLQ